MRKKKEAPIEQGSLKDLYSYFLLPLINYKPEDTSLADWYASLFHLDYRDISLYEARMDFKLPGLFYAAPYVKIQGIGYREVKTHDNLFIRKDLRDDFYDVQFFGGPGEADQVFQLSNHEFNQIGPNLEKVDGGISRRKKVRDDRAKRRLEQ